MSNSGGVDTSSDERIARALAEAEQQGAAAGYRSSAARHPLAYPGRRSSSTSSGAGRIVRGRAVPGGDFHPSPAAAAPGNAAFPPNDDFFRQPAPMATRIRSHMCHVPCLLGSGNDVCVEMMVDTGAELSVISLQLARELRLDSKIDTSHRGVAAGVGRARITGKIRDVVATFGHVEFRMEFAVLEVPDRLLILGMDQMRKYNCVIDLQRDVLVFGGAGGVEVPMLPPDKLPTYDARIREQCAVS